LLKANTFWSILFLHFGNFLRLLQLVNVVSNRSDCLFKFQPNVNHSTGLLLTELDTNNCRAMLFKRAYAVMRCLSARVSVRPSVMFVDSVETNLQKNFSPSGSHTLLVFPYQTSWRYSDADLPNGASNAGGVGRNRATEPISGFVACCQRCDRLARCYQHGAAGLWQVVTLTAGSKRWSLLMAGDDDEMF